MTDNPPSQSLTAATMSQTILSVPLDKSWRLLNHGPTVLVASAHGERRNLMAAAWSMPLDFSPPKVAVVIDKSTLSRELIEASGEFVLAVPTRAQAALTLAVGSRSGREGDKFAALGIDTFAGERVAAPLVAGCLGWLECRVLPEPHIQNTYDLFLAEIVAAHADAALFRDGHWHFDGPETRSIHYVSGGHFFSTGEAFETAEPA